MSHQATQDFARTRRIVTADEFSSAFRLRPVQRSAHFVLYVRPNELANARLGVVVAKRFAPRAVTRNTIKRVTREVFRMSTLPAIDCVVRLSTPVNTKAGPATCSSLKKALRVELLRLFAAAQRPVRSGKPGGAVSGDNRNPAAPPVAPDPACAGVPATAMPGTGAEAASGPAAGVPA